MQSAELKILRIVVVCILLACGGFACPQSQDVKGVNETLSAREDAFKKLELEKIFSLYDPGYKTSQYSIEELKTLARTSTPRLRNLSILFSSRDIYPSDNGSASVVENFEVSGEVGGRKMSYHNKEGLRLKPAPNSKMMITEGDKVLDIIAFRMVTESEVMLTLDQRKRAIQTHNPESYMDVISGSYSDPKGDRESLKGWVGEMMNGDAWAMLQIGEARVYIQQDTALAEEPWSLMDRKTGEELDSGVQGIQLKKEGAIWKIVGGLRK